WTYLGERREPLPRDQAVIQGLSAAVHNWTRGVAQHGHGEYLYGPAAYQRWIQDLGRATTFTEQEQATLFFVSWWNFDTLCDARRGTPGADGVCPRWLCARSARRCYAD